MKCLPTPTLIRIAVPALLTVWAWTAPQASAAHGTWTLIPADQLPVYRSAERGYFAEYGSDSQGNVYMADSAKLFVYAQGMTREIPVPRPTGFVNVDMAVDPAGPVWVLTSFPQTVWSPTRDFSLHRYALGNWSTVPLQPCGSGNFVSLYGVDASGRVIMRLSQESGSLIGTLSVKTLRLGAGACAEIDIPQRSDGMMEPRGFSRDGQGGEYLWGLHVVGDIILGEFGLILGDPSRLVYPERGSFRIRSIHGLDGQTLAILSDGVGVLRDGDFPKINPVQGVTVREADIIFQDSRKDIWIPFEQPSGGTVKKVMLQMHAGDTVIHSIPLEPNQGVTHVVEDDRGNVWFFAYGGLLVWTLPGNERPLALGPRLPKPRIMPWGGAEGRDALGRSRRGMSRFGWTAFPLP